MSLAARKFLDRQNYSVKRVAFKCGIDRNSIVLPHLSEILIRTTSTLPSEFRSNADFVDFYVTRTTNTRSSILFITPVGRKNVVYQSIKGMLPTAQPQQLSSVIFHPSSLTIKEFVFNCARPASALGALSIEI